MHEVTIVRSMLLRIGRGVPASSPLAKAVLDWARPQAAWLLPGRPARGPRLSWTRLRAEVAAAARPCTRPSQPIEIATALAAMLGLGPIDAALLALMVACDRLPRVRALARILSRHGCDLPALLGELAGAEPHEAERMVQRSPVLRLGLVRFHANRQSEVEVEIRWALTRTLDRALGGDVDLVDSLVGPRQSATLDLAAFRHVAEADLLVRLLRGALTQRAPGVNILIHGPPGTGKTEIARTLAAAAGATLRGIGEADEDGDEPRRWDRVQALQLAQRVLATRDHTVLLFDEMEDLIGEAAPSGSDWFERREGSKVFVNRLIEVNPIPVIWTTNAIGNIDRAILRRMSFVLKLGLPSRGAALAMLDRIAAEERVQPGARFTALIDAAPETATVLRTAARTGRLAGEADGGVQAAEALVRALRGAELPDSGPGEVDLALVEADRDLEALFAALHASGALDVSLLLKGPPGTGKTALAHHLARALDRPLIVKRASDLLSKWVGETEAQIAEAFAEARQRGGVLLFDEADSLLFDRATARNSWEVGQVNELLTWLDRHPLPVIAATNHADKLDPATLRRFVFKLELRPLGRDRARAAFLRFFGMAAPAVLDGVTGLTLGDYAVVARQLRHAPAASVADIAERLAREVAARPGTGDRIGF